MVLTVIKWHSWSDSSIIILLQDLKLNINGVNILDPAFPCEKEIQYNHYHLEITATSDQEMNLKERLLAQSLAIDIKRFDLAECQQADHANDVQNAMLQSDCESGGMLKNLK